MTLAVSILLLSFGAVLVWGLDADVAGIDLDVIGAVAMITGVAGAFLAMALYGSRPARNERVRRREYLER